MAETLFTTGLKPRKATGPRALRSGMLMAAALSFAVSPILAPVMAQDLGSAKTAGVDLTSDGPLRAVGAKPVAKSLEDGIWVETDKAEFKAKSSGERTRQAALETYVQSVMNKVMGPHQGEARVYVMERPFFNATMAPNGYTEVWTGLLLRAQTEDELAFVLGHEAGHYLHSHSLRAYQGFKDRQNAALAASIVISIVAMGAAANANSYNAASNISNAASGLIDIVYLGTIAAYFGYSRETEGFADVYGHSLASGAGYDATAGETIWQGRLSETSASDYEKVRNSPTRINIFGSHPLESQRIDVLKSYNKALSQKIAKPLTAEDKRAARTSYRTQIRPYLGAWLKDDLRRQDYGQTLHIINALSIDGLDMGLLNFYKGEALRLRAKNDDLKMALAAYQSALAAPDAPPQAHRQMG